MSLRRLTNFGWTRTHALGALAMACVGIYATWGAWKDIYDIAWNDAESSHIFLVPIVAAWMFWVRRARLRFCPPTGTVIGPLLVAVGWLVSVYGFNAMIQALHHVGAVMVVLGCVLSVLGKNVLFRFFPAFAVLVFLVPVPGRVRLALAGPLQNAAAGATQAIFETMGIAVERSGNLLTINGVDVAVAEACNGMRMVFALVLVSYAFAFSMPLRNWVRLVVLLASPLSALMCNVIRLIPTVWLYGNASKETADTFHDYSGWVMLPIAFMLLLGVIRTLRWALVPVARYNLAYQ
ncbi:MAG: exosortase/archaeosortase family protein [Phycisphaerales bacterium]